MNLPSFAYMVHVEFLQSESDNLAALLAGQGKAVESLIVDEKDLLSLLKTLRECDTFQSCTCRVGYFGNPLLEEIVDHHLFTLVPS